MTARSPAGRHQVVLGLLLLHVPVFAVWGLRQDWSLLHVVGEVVVPLIALFAIARWASRPRVAMGAGGIGLMYASAVLVHLADGVTEAHFYFFVAFGLVALYRDWIVFFAAAGFAVAHHVVFALAGDALFDQPYQLENPLFWAAVHVSFVTVVTAVQAVGMQDVARSTQARTHLADLVARAEERRQTALVLHDDVVQALAAVKYAEDLDEPEIAAQALARALDRSRGLVSELLGDDPLDERVLVRPTASGQVV